MSAKQQSEEGNAKRRWMRFFPVFADVEEELQDEQQEMDALDKNEATKQSILDKYNDYPLAQSMLASEPIRNETLIRDGRKQGDYVKSNDGWLNTLLVLEV